MTRDGDGEVNLEMRVLLNGWAGFIKLQAVSLTGSVHSLIFI